MKSGGVRALSAGMLLFAALVAQSTVAAQPQPAELLLRDGVIYTQSDTKPWAQAVAIHGGKIVALGSNAAMDSYKGEGTRVIDLGRNFAMPGINDVHVHVHGAGRELAQYNCTVSQYSTFEQVLDAVRQCATKMPAEDWIIGAHWGSGLYGTLQKSDAIKALDAVSGGHPVILRVDTNHDIWVNSRALAIAGVTRDTPNPTNGVIGRDPSTGELNGLLIEGSAGKLVEKRSPLGAPPGPDENLKRLQFGLRMLSSFGVTGFQDAAVTPDLAEMFAAADRAGALHARASLCMVVDPNAPGDLSKLFNDAARGRSGRLEPDCAKIFLDGVMVSHTAMFLEPYLPDEKHGANFRGDPKTTSQKLDPLVTELDRRGISVKLHCAGDGAVHQAIEAIEAARKSNGPNGPIHTLAHAGFVAPSDLPRMKALRIAADASPTVWYPGPIIDATARVIGKERTYRFWPVNTMLQQGVLVAGGTDWKSLPAEFSDLWSGIEGLVTRRNPTGRVEGILDAEQAVKVEAALGIYTINTAKALRIDKVTGSLEPGKSADMIVLDRDPFRIAPEEISDTKVLMTFFAGELVYERNNKAR